ncbi:hypothetical protein CEY16_08590 [Halalkalibacillus sediminis]|uniref:Uncharacterized protein n=1 Tax=Halalkalibacillus sediminis TaxID=2018042 RepID=A0A2I0QV46_9BACI|nr:hypothetical protein [Halalkalibacillus sediminis]PKR77970.1 hypothetical protein CEY16_08590 [Halalkalibacillus sediminis]
MRKVLLILFLFITYVLFTNGLDFYERWENSFETSISKDSIADPLPLDTPEKENSLPSSEEKSNSIMVNDESWTISAPEKLDDSFQEEIPEEYEKRFISLEEEIMEEIQQLKNEAAEEYENENNLIKRGLLLLKYERQAADLEDEADVTFHELLSELELELEGNDDSKEIISDLQLTYNSTKKEIKDAFVQEVNQWLQTPSEEY